MACSQGYICSARRSLTAPESVGVPALPQFDMSDQSDEDDSIPDQFQLDVDAAATVYLANHMDNLAHLIPEIPNLQDQDLPSYRQCWDDLMPLILYSARIFDTGEILSAFPQDFVNSLDATNPRDVQLPQGQEEYIEITCHKAHASSTDRVHRGL